MYGSHIKHIKEWGLGIVKSGGVFEFCLVFTVESLLRHHELFVCHDLTQ